MLGEARVAVAGTGGKRGLGLHKLGPRTVGSYVPTVTKKVLERFGFAAAAIVTDWASIVGARLAAQSEPIRLKWPRPGSATEGAPADRPAAAAFAAGARATETKRRGKSGPATERGPATLVLRVENACALDVQYNARQIIERINAHFGYRAVAELRIVQGPIGRDSRSPTLPAAAAPLRSPSPAAPLDLSTVVDAGLREALGRLAKSVAASPPNG